jgi:hypothetical protein
MKSNFLGSAETLERDDFGWNQHRTTQVFVFRMIPKAGVYFSGSCTERGRMVLLKNGALEIPTMSTVSLTWSSTIT